jgi:hypothetical protein
MVFLLVVCGRGAGALAAGCWLDSQDNPMAFLG